MKELAIKKGNKLIAEFMGIKVADSYLDAAFSNDSWCVFELKYHTSWDELMPVVEKIEKSCTIVINGMDVRIMRNPYELTIHIEDEKISKKIEAVWQAVVEFIQLFKKEVAK